MSTPKTCLVIDVEATCWDKNLPKGAPKVAANGEIIEIGITSIDIKNKTILESESIIVWPTTTEISEFCTSLTSLTPEYVDANGIHFVDAIDILRKEYRVDRNMWASWGMYDEQQFRKQCLNENLKYPFSNNYLNVKSLFCWKYGFNCGLGKACKHMGLTFDGTAHRGVDDSYNIARVLLSLYK